MASHAHCSMKPERRALPKAQSPEDQHMPLWMAWNNCPPHHPGWYWVCSKGVWPQCVECAYVRGKLRFVDRHSEHQEEHDFWEVFAGPIPDPPTPKLPLRSRRK